MDINHLTYFVEIVDSDFNISNASKKLHVSQPALSQVIKKFELDENIVLFERQKGRLKNLTLAGEHFYVSAKNVLKEYNLMMDSLREDSHLLKGKVRIGIPPLVLSMVFSEVLTKLIINNPEIEFDIVERGAFDLSKMLLLQELDYAVLLSPTYIDKELVTEYTLREDVLTGFMDKDNPLCNNDELEWWDLSDKFLAIFDHSFMIHHKIVEKCKNEGIIPSRTLMSSSWDYLMLSTIDSDLVTILPAPMYDIFNHDRIVMKYFKDPIQWKVVLCRLNKKHYTHADQFVFDFIVDYFQN
ncbi:MAG: LysR family transcriptional regulator [Clostridioides sp.]|jgi:DNA-binding transcriptional LysR family regulator|nr:LysR family transcriptional regulator [Clostridioides sp.]